MKVGDLVRLKPEHIDHKWIDILFIIVEESTECSVIIANPDWSFPISKYYLEVIDG